MTSAEHYPRGVSLCVPPVSLTLVAERRGTSGTKMADKLFRLPTLSDDGANYESWKKDIDLWCLASSLSGKKQAIAIHLSLSGKARIATSEIDLSHAPDAEAVNKIKDKLDSIFLPEKGIRQFNAFSRLFNMRRQEDMKMIDFISEFEHTAYKFQQEGMILPDAVMAFMVLGSSRLSDSESHMVMSGIKDVTFASVRAALLRIFGHSFQSAHPMQSIGASNVEIKSETLCSDSSNSGGEVLYTRGGYTGRRGWSSGRGRGAYGRGSWRAGSRKSSSAGRASDRRQNPVDAEGKVTTCAVCSSTMHWARDCPHSYENAEEAKDKESEKINFSALVGCTEVKDSQKLKLLSEELHGCALLDSGCANTVCGESWMSNFIENLSDLERSQVKVQSSDQQFTFGDGRTVVSKRRVTFPCYIDGTKGEITTDVVDCELPLLLSLKSMKSMGFKIDFKEDILIFYGRRVKLSQLKSGHYRLPLTL